MEISSSQESLPFSQETFVSMINGIPEEYRDILFDGRVINSSLFQPNPPAENNNAVQNSPLVDANLSHLLFQNNVFERPALMDVPLEGLNSTARIPQISSVPATEDFPGCFNFNVSLPPVQNLSKVSPFVYSSLLGRLYIKRGTACPFNFSATPYEDGFQIRAVIYFTSHEHVNDVAIRCMNHAFADEEKGDILSEHLVRCESPLSSYCKDQESERCSVVVPFDNPPVGQDYSTYMYKFMCFTSCSGGPNRRPISVVFSLENKGYVMGRSKMDLKVCSCPYRDKTYDEKKLTGENKNAPSQNEKDKTSLLGQSSLVDITNEPKNQPKQTTKRKVEETTLMETCVVKKKDVCETCHQPLLNKFQDKELTKLLKMVTRYYIINKALKPSSSNWTPTATDVVNLLSVLSSSDEDK